MPDDSRINLSGDLDQVASDLLKDVKAATDQVKDRKAAIAAQDALEAQKSKSRRMSALLVGIGAVVVLLLSYWVVFARPDGAASGPNSGVTSSSGAETPKVPIKCPVPTATGSSATRSGACSPVGRDPQVVTQPSDEFEQPSDAGM